MQPKVMESNDIEFHIPTSVDDLTSERWKELSRYTVSEILNIDEIPARLTECLDAMCAENMLFVLNNFEPLFSVVVHFSKLNWKTLTKAWDIIFQGFKITVKKLGEILAREMDQTEQSRYRNATKMIMYLLTQYMKGFEDRLAGCGKGKNKISKQSESDDWNWKERCHEALKEIYNCLQLPIHRLWNPPFCEATFADMIGNACFKALEDPGITQVKMKPMCETVYQIIGTLVKNLSNGFSCIVRIGQMLHVYDHLVSSMVRCIVVLIEDFKCSRIVVEILNEISRMDTGESASHSGAARSYGQFISELSEAVPHLVVPHVRLLEPLLDVEAYAMRNAVLSSFCTLVEKCLSGEDLTEDAKAQRDELLDHMEDHILDVNAFVRSKVLQLWQHMVRQGAVPISYHGSVLEKTIGRLQDKSANVKKSAIQLVAAFLEQNPFASRLGLNELKQQLESEQKKLDALEASTNSIAAELAEKVEAEWNQMESSLRSGLAEILDHDNEIADADDTSDLMEIPDEEDVEELCGRVCELIVAKDYQKAYKQFRIFEEKLPSEVQCLQNCEDNEQLVDQCVKVFQKIYFMYHGYKSSSSDNFKLKEIKEVKLVINYLKDSVTYVELMDQALPAICALLSSLQTSDIVEAVEFITRAYQFGLSQADESMRQLLTLVLSGNESVVSAVSDAYCKVFLRAEDPANETVTSGDVKDKRKKAHQIVKNLCHLVSTVDIGQKEALDSLIIEWVKKGFITPGCIQIMWEWAAMSQPDVTADDTRCALMVLEMLSVEKAAMMKERLPFLLALGLGERGMDDFLLASTTCRIISKSNVTSDRLPENHIMFTSLHKLICKGFSKIDDLNYSQMAGDAIDLIYQLSAKPVGEMESILVEIAEQLSDSELKKNETDADSQSKNYCAQLVSRFLFVVGHVSLRHMIHLEEFVYNELKEKNAAKNKKSKSNSRKSVYSSPNANQSEDREREQVRKWCEDDVVTGSGMLAKCSKFVIEICSQPSAYEGTSVLTSAFLALSKMMLVSSEFCSEHIQLFMTALKTSKEEIIRANCLIAFADIAFRFPNVVEPWTGYLCDSLKDPTSDTVRQTAVMILTHLVINDMVKVRSQVADLALCLNDPDSEISDTAKAFFHELSQKGNTLYNVLPDIISKLSNPEINIDDNKFRSILKFLLGLVQRERQVETLVEKLCQRLAAAPTDKQTCNLAYCIGMLPYNEKSLRYLVDNISCYAEKLHQQPVFDSFMNVVTSNCNNPKIEIKVVCDELEFHIKNIVSGQSEVNENGVELLPFSTNTLAKKTPARRTGSRKPQSSVRKNPQRGKTPRRPKRRTPTPSPSPTSDSDLE